MTVIDLANFAISPIGHVLSLIAKFMSVYLFIYSGSSMERGCSFGKYFLLTFFALILMVVMLLQERFAGIYNGLHMIK